MDKLITKKLKKSHIEKTVDYWGGGKEYELLDDVQNIIYKFRIKDEYHILRFSHSSERTNDDILSEIHWINYLRENRIPAAKPIKTLDGSFIKIIDIGDSYFVASVFEYAKGDFISIDGEIYWNPKFLEKWGSIVGRLHSLTKNYVPDSKIKKRHDWQKENPVEGAKKCVPKQYSKVVDEIDYIYQQIIGLPKTKNTYGLIHNDLNPTNFFYSDGEVTIFDFDDCCYNYFLHDIAGAIPFYSRKFYENNWQKYIKTFFKSFLKGYFTENTMDNAEFASLPLFLKYANFSGVIFSFEIDEKNRMQYDDYFKIVLYTFENGHNLFNFDFKTLVENFPFDK